MAEQTQEKTRGNAKVREGIVVSNKMDKTIVVSIVRLMKHPAVGKYVRVTKKCVAHDEQQTAKEGDTVRIVETRPLSKTKRWRLQEVITRAV